MHKSKQTKERQRKSKQKNFPKFDKRNFQGKPKSYKHEISQCLRFKFSIVSFFPFDIYVCMDRANDSRWMDAQLSFICFLYHWITSHSSSYSAQSRELRKDKRKQCDEPHSKQKAHTHMRRRLKQNIMNGTEVVIGRQTTKQTTSESEMKKINFRRRAQSTKSNDEMEIIQYL